MHFAGRVIKSFPLRMCARWMGWGWWLGESRSLFALLKGAELFELFLIRSLLVRLFIFAITLGFLGFFLALLIGSTNDEGGRVV